MTTTPIEERPTTLYRLLGADGARLYIGITCDLPTRLKAHATTKDWAKVASISVKQYPDRAAAEAAEREAIRTERPAWNKAVQGADGRWTGVGRRRFTAEDEQQRLLDEAATLAAQADHLDEQAWAAIKAARDAGVPDTLLCSRTGRPRATLNRRYGSRTD